MIVSRITLRKITLKKLALFPFLFTTLLNVSHLPGVRQKIDSKKM